MAMLTVRRALCYNIATVVAVTVVAKREDIVMRFFDRARELADLKEIRERSESVAQFTVVTGRRRVGKTSLVVKSQLCHFLFRECPFDPIAMRLFSSLPHNFRLHHQKTDIDDFSLVSSPFVYAWGVTFTPNALRIVPMSSPSASSIM